MSEANPIKIYKIKPEPQEFLPMPSTVRYDKVTSKRLYHPWTECESILSKALINADINFTCHVPIDGEIADFVFTGSDLIVEVDGSYYHSQHKKLLDEQKHAYLESKGFTVIHFTNRAVRESTRGVVAAIRRHLSLS